MAFGVADLAAAAEVVQKVDGNPLRLAGRFLGLSGPETDAGIPTWGWCALALGVGFIGGVMASRSDFLRERLGGG
jgi:hypothetical protein